MSPQYLKGQYDCDLERFGEVKAIVWGATSIAGSLKEACSKGLIRNVDQGNDFEQEPLQYHVFPFEITPAEEESLRVALQAGKRAMCIWQKELMQVLHESFNG